MRGQLALSFIDFSETQQNNTDQLIISKGRSKDLITRRNKKIIARYYYHNALCKKNLNGTIELLMLEFDLDDRTLSLILKKEADAIIEMKQKKPSKDSLKKQFHWPRW